MFDNWGLVVFYDGTFWLYKFPLSAVKFDTFFVSRFLPHDIKAEADETSSACSSLLIFFFLFARTRFLHRKGWWRLWCSFIVYGQLMVLTKWVEWRRRKSCRKLLLAHDEMKPRTHLNGKNPSMELANRRELFTHSSRQSIEPKAEGELNWVKTFIELCPVVAIGDSSSR